MLKLRWVFLLPDKWSRLQKAFAENVSFHTKTQGAENESFFRQESISVFTFFQLFKITCLNFAF